MFLHNDMSEQDVQAAEATISDEELELDLTPDGTEDADTLAEKLRNAEKAKKQILARARKAEAELKLSKEAVLPQKQEVQTSAPDIEDKVWSIAEMIREGYSRADVDFIMKNGGREALKDQNSYVSLALKTKMEQERAEAASAQTSIGSGESEVLRKHTPEQLRNMSAEELEKLLPHA